MALIFVSYRTGDSVHVAAAVHERLVTAFGPEQVFRDVRSMRPGERYPAVIRAALRRAAVVVAVIGPGWLAADERGQRLVDRAEDWVRWEITTAVEFAIPIVPVLVDDTPLPDASMLPGRMAELTRFQAARVRHTDQGSDLDRLAAALMERVPALAPSRRIRRSRKGSITWRIATAAVCVIVGIGLLVGAWSVIGREDADYSQPAASGEQVVDGDGFVLRNLISANDDTKTRVSANLVNTGRAPLVLNKVRLRLQKSGGICTSGPDGYGYVLDRQLAVSDGGLTEGQIMATAGPLHGLSVSITGVLLLDICGRLAVLDAAFPTAITLQPLEATWLTIDIPNELEANSIDGRPIGELNRTVRFTVLGDNHKLRLTALAVKFDGNSSAACAYRVDGRLNDPADAATAQLFCNEDW